MSATHSVNADPHVEKHFTATDIVRDVVIGMADGLTVPFALAAGISGAVAQSHIVVTAGVAEIVAGSIAMGLGGYLAARSDVEHFESEKRREIAETHAMPEEERREIASVFHEFGVSGPLLDELTNVITSDRTRWVNFMMKFELGLDEPDAKRAPMSALRIGGSYIVGGIIPLAPYALTANASHALIWSSALTLSALLIFGAVKGRFTGVKPLRSAVQTALIGGLAAAAAFFLARAIS